MVMIKGHEPKARWNVADAKAHLSELLRRAGHEAQVIENRGHEVAVVLGVEQYGQLRAEAERGAPRRALLEFLRLSEDLRRRGGATLKIPARRPRRSPFAPRPRSRAR